MASNATEADGGRFVSLSDEATVRELLRTIVLDLWKVVNTLSRLKPSRHERYRVAVFGSARAQPGTFGYVGKMWPGLMRLGAGEHAGDVTAARES
jgi:hypothetical protein